MSKHITVGVDGSTDSARALVWAAAAARRHGFDLEIVYALDAPSRTADAYRLPDISDEAVAGLEKFGNELVTAAERQAIDIAPGITTSARTELGSPAAVLLAAAESSYCIVLGSRGLGALSGLLGSVSMKVASRANSPVIVISDRIPDAILESRPIDGVVVGVDDSAFSVAALRFALQEAASQGVPVQAVSAYASPFPTVPLEPSVLAQAERTARKQAETAIDNVIAAAQSPATRNVEIKRLVADAQPVESILAVAENASLIVVGSHGRGLVRRIFLGSVSRQLLHEADRPIAVVNDAE